MPGDNTTCIRVYKETKKKFEELCKEEELPLIKCIEIILNEAISRGYVDKERHELFEHLKKAK